MLSKIKFEWPLLKIELDVRIEVKESVAPHRTIDWQPITSYHELSIVATIQRRREPLNKMDTQRGAWRDVAFGQCRNEVRERAVALSEPQRVALLELLDIWECWHLNGMNAGVRPQRDALRSRARHEPAVLEYSAACKYLATLGLLTTTHTKYTYGSAWLVEVLPPEVTTRVRQLCETLGGKVLEAA